MKKSTDFTRDVVPIFGVPFDVIDQEEALRRVTNAVAQGRKYFVSTPNLNFLALCQRDEAFRQSVLMSDLSIADGMSVTLLSRWLGTPLPERIAGSTLFEVLSARLSKQLKVYLFGGPDGVAERAATQMNSNPSAASAVGWLSPGFCSVNDMSSPERLALIEQSHPNFVLVALGAHKGQAWIVRNLEALPNAVICHLGAVINFLAGSVHRAPRIVQALRLEWLWRIKEEPALWRRYRDDALLVSGRLLHLLFASRKAHWKRELGSSEPYAAHLIASEDGLNLRLSGTWNDNTLQPLADTLTDATKEAASLFVRIEPTCRLSPRALGKLLLLAGHQLAVQRPLEIEAANRALHAALTNAGLAPWLQSKPDRSTSEHLPPEATPSAS